MIRLCTAISRRPPVSGVPYWYWLGGRPALDFVNTRRERWRRDVECLLSVEEVVVVARARPAAAAADEGARLGARRGARAARGDRRRRARRRRGAGARSRAVALIDDWLALAGSRPALLTDRPAGRCSPSARGPTRRAARSGWSPTTPRACSGSSPSGRACASAARTRARHASTTARPPRAAAGARWRCAATRTRHDDSGRGHDRIGRRSRVRHQDRRARPRGRRAALPRYRHRGRSSAPCRSSRSGGCWSTGASSPAWRPPSRTS